MVYGVRFKLRVSLPRTMPRTSLVKDRLAAENDEALKTCLQVLQHLDENAVELLRWKGPQHALRHRFERIRAKSREKSVAPAHTEAWHQRFVWVSTWMT